MAATQRQYPPFVRQAQANAGTKLSAVSKDGKMTPAQQDRQIFVTAGELLYGTKNIYTAGLALDKLGLPDLRRKATSDFFSGLDEDQARGGLHSASACWKDFPTPSTNLGVTLWDKFKKAPSKTTHDALLAAYPSAESAPTSTLATSPKVTPTKSAPGVPAVAQTKTATKPVGQPMSAASLSSGPTDVAPVTSKRTRKPPSRMREYSTDDEHESNTAQKTRRTSSSSTASKRKATASDCETGSPTPAQRPAKKAKESAQAASSASKSARPAARPAARKAATKKKVNHLLPKANPRPLNAAERRQVRQAQCLEDEASDAQDDEFSEDENGDHGDDDSGSEDDYVPHHGQPSDDEDPPSDPPQPSDVEPLPIERKKVTKNRRKTDELYTDIDEKWLCLLCERKYTAHPNSKSNLYLHLNAKSNRNHCKHLYKPKDPRFVGHFTPPPPDAPDDDDESGPSPSGSKSGSVVSTVRQKKLDGWVVDQKAVGLKAKIEEVRRLILEWIVMDNQPFTTAKRPRFQAILLALNPGVGPAMMSARQLRRDLDAAYSSTISQLVAHIINNKIAFTISHDAWTSPSRRYTFLCFVVSFVDMDWTFKQCILGFQVLQGAHTGATLAGHLILLLRKHGLLDLWTGVLVGDAASANGRMCDVLQYEFAKRARRHTAEVEEAVKHRRGDHAVFCFNHALNRAMADFYAAVGVKVKKTKGVLQAATVEEEDGESVQTLESKQKDLDAEDSDAESDDGEEADPPSASQVPLDAIGDLLTSEDEVHQRGEDGNSDEVDPEAAEAADIYADVRCQLETILEDDEDEGEELETVDGGAMTNVDLGAPINKIARIVKEIHSSSEALREFTTLMSMYYKDDPKKVKIVPPKFNATRWNSRYKQLRRALKISDGLVFYVKNSERPKVKKEELSPADFEGLVHVTDIIKYIHNLTLNFEASQPHACQVLQAFGDLMHVLNIEIEEAKSLQNDGRVEGHGVDKLVKGLESIRSKLQLYQEAAIGCETLVIAAVLNPEYRLGTIATDYAQHVDQAKILLKREVDRISPSSAQPPKAARKEPMLKAKWQRSAPVVPAAATVSVVQTELDAYLANRHEFRKPEAGQTFPADTILGWWKEHESHFPNLAKVARRFLSAPGSTSEVERVFSRAGRYVSGRRPLGPTALQQLVVTSQLMTKGYEPFSVNTQSARMSSRPQTPSTAAAVSHSGTRAPQITDQEELAEREGGEAMWPWPAGTETLQISSDSEEDEMYLATTL